jgi:hypothetical protein
MILFQIYYYHLYYDKKYINILKHHHLFALMILKLEYKNLLNMDNLLATGDIM